MATRNWEEIGLSWQHIDVKERAGKNASDDRVIGKVWAPVVDDASKLAAHVGPDVMKGHLNHASSFTVRARAWYKGRHKADAKAARNMPEETMKEGVYQAVILNARSSRMTRTVRVTTLVAGDVKVTVGGDYPVMPYEELFATLLAGWIDAGVAQHVARGVVAKSLATAGIEPDDETDEDEDEDNTQDEDESE